MSVTLGWKALLVPEQHRSDFPLPDGTEVIFVPTSLSEPQCWNVLLKSGYSFALLQFGATSDQMLLEIWEIEILTGALAFNIAGKVDESFSFAQGTFRIHNYLSGIELISTISVNISCSATS